ncbi:hypothetical protein [Deinococcus peraridilitoris]|uniref:Uncharacterized protein n=1 Tax=Deinococcus peraridilitoris (strain DSM 19664 / LMG 22246 / CIP 109416 / KR-200) TaxID=937777 RepID=L0A2B6_DEIPD|nr:hypothetical protein [Deinococcus peraridilitoris]AFZ67584.1 hypothetical protein Deipe_2088 [Deinococcus peraridilitoris DSM 19664]
MKDRIPPPVRLLVSLVWATDWRVFAAIGALMALLASLPLCLNPHIYDTSHAYLKLSSWGPSQAFGLALFVPAFLTLACLHLSIARFAVLGVFVVMGTVAYSFVLSVGFAVAPLLYCLASLLSLFAYARSDS